MNIHEITQNEAFTTPINKMVNCCVPLCSNSHRKVKKVDRLITFYNFSKEKKLRNVWKIKIKRDEGTLFKVFMLLLNHSRGTSYPEICNGYVSDSANSAMSHRNIKIPN